MLEQLLNDGLGGKSLKLMERLLDGDETVSPTQGRAAMSVMSAEIKARGARNRDMSNAITVIKMHPDKALREASAEALLRRLLPEVQSSSPALQAAQVVSGEQQERS